MGGRRGSNKLESKKFIKLGSKNAGKALHFSLLALRDIMGT